MKLYLLNNSYSLLIKNWQHAAASKYNYFISIEIELIHELVSELYILTSTSG